MVKYLQILLNARLAKMDERGATAVEYGLLVALIAMLIIGAVFLLGGNLSDLFNGAADEVANPRRRLSTSATNHAGGRGPRGPRHLHIQTIANRRRHGGRRR